MNFDWIVVGAGFTGATIAERLASQCDKNVLVVDRRPHVGGNAYDYRGEHGILVHKYGPHIFHTNSQRVFSYLAQFTAWRPYYHHVLAVVEGRAVPLPFSLDSIMELFPSFLAEDIMRRLIATYGFGKKVPILKLRESNDELLKFVADFVYDNVFKNYTQKQWSLRPEELDPSVTARVPIYVSRDRRYFQDTYQAMPLDGYSAMFTRMLNHPNIRVSLATDYEQVRALWPNARTVFTGPIDEYFARSHGALPYRSVRFELKRDEREFYQQVATVNYPNEFDFTRITEFKHLTGQVAAGTLIVEEYPEAYKPGVNEPYYPIPTADASEKLKPYQAMAQDLRGKVWFAGRLGDYAYYNMDQACARALALFEKQLAHAT